MCADVVTSMMDPYSSEPDRVALSLWADTFTFPVMTPVVFIVPPVIATLSAACVEMVPSPRPVRAVDWEFPPVPPFATAMYPVAPGAHTDSAMSPAPEGVPHVPFP